MPPPPGQGLGGPQVKVWGPPVKVQVKVRGGPGQGLGQGPGGPQVKV